MLTVSSDLLALILMSLVPVSSSISFPESETWLESIMNGKTGNSGYPLLLHCLYPGQDATTSRTHRLSPYDCTSFLNAFFSRTSLKSALHAASILVSDGGISTAPPPSPGCSYKLPISNFDIWFIPKGITGLFLAKQQLPCPQPGYLLPPHNLAISQRSLSCFASASIPIQLSFQFQFPIRLILFKISFLPSFLSLTT